MSRSIVSRESLDALFKPNHIAVIGASTNPLKLGYSVVRNLVSCGFAGRISPINSSGGEVMGLNCRASLAEIEDRPDCAIIVVPHTAALGAVRDCAASGVKAIVLPVTGFAESDTPEGRERQAELKRIAEESGMRILGPNTNGFYNAVDRVSLGYNSTHAELLKPGIISIASHSGAMFGGIARTLDRLGFGISKFVAVGNEADLDMMDFIEYFIDDPSTRVIGLIIETISDGRRLRHLAERAAQAGKPIAAVKVGRSEAGIGAALAHSSRLSGGARAYDALFHAAGIASVGTIEALAGGCAVLASRTPATAMADRKLICITTSGAGGAMLADGAAERGMPLAGTANGEWTSSVAEELRAFGVSARIRNPIDLGVVGNDWKKALFEIYSVLESAGMDGPTIVYTHIPASKGQDFQILDALIERKARTSSPIAVVVPGGLSAEAEEAYAREKIPFFHDTVTCLESLKCHYALSPRGDIAPSQNRRDANGGSGWINALGRGRFLSEVESAGVLRSFGIRTVDSYPAENLAEAESHGQTIGYPVVLKALAPNVTHKNQSGFVQVGLDAISLPLAFADMERKIAAAGYSKHDVKFIVQPMIKAKAELILGVSHEGPLGHFVLVGLGGIYTELFDQVLLFPVPTARTELISGIQSSWVGRFVGTVYGAGPAAIVEEIADALEALQTMIIDHGEHIDSIDVNPLLITDDGCMAVDALIVASSGGRPRA